MYLNQLISNRILVGGIIGWASAQIIKTIIFLIVNRKLQLERLVGDGGMPSAHSTTVTSVAMLAGLELGFDSPIFAVAAIMAIVVMHDAMGVRLETGKQAKVLNDMMDLFEKMNGAELSNQQKLKEFVGHTPLQVICGAVLGVIVAFIVNAF